MVIRISGEGKKEAFLREMLRAEGHIVQEAEPDVWVLPIPFSAAEAREPEAVQGIKHLVLGKADKRFTEAAQRKGWKIHPILEDETYAAKNADLSAEGAVFAALSKTEDALAGSSCAVIGNGRLGTALHRILLGIGAQVSMAARRRTALDEMPMEQLAAALPRFDFVFNTVPFPVLTGDVLLHASPKTWFLELASAPYGIDRKAAEELGLRYALESGIPGRYCPKASARNIADYLERSVLKNE